VVWLVGLAVVALVACGDDDEGAPAATAPPSTAPSETAPADSGPPSGEIVTDSAVIVDRIVDAGICGDAREKPAEQLTEGVDNAMICVTETGEEITIEGFADEARLEAFLRRSETEGCAIFAGMDVPYVSGRWWTGSVPIDVGPQGEAVFATELYDELAEASQGEVRAIEC
jgi:hypothetical protein